MKNKGEARGRTEKIIWGFSMIFLIVLLLLLPLMLFSSDSSALVSNPVKFASMDVNLAVMGEPLSLYSFSRSADIVDANRTEYYRWQNMFKGSIAARGFICSRRQDGSAAQMDHRIADHQHPLRGISIPSLSEPQSNHPWAVLEEYTNRVIDIVSKDCSSVQLDLQVMFDRDLPSVLPRSLSLIAQEAQTVTQKITKTLNQTQCDTLIQMLDLSSIVDPSKEPLSIVFEHLYRPFLSLFEPQLSSHLLPQQRQ